MTSESREDNMPPPNMVCQQEHVECQHNPRRSIDLTLNSYIPSYVVITSPIQPLRLVQPSHYDETSLPQMRLSSAKLAPVPPNRSISPPLPIPSEQRLSSAKRQPSSPSLQGRVGDRFFVSNSPVRKKKQHMSECELRMNRWDSSGSRSSLYGSQQGSRDFTPTIPGQRRHVEISEMKNFTWNNASLAIPRRGEERDNSVLYPMKPEAAGISKSKHESNFLLTPGFGDSHFSPNNVAS